MNADYVTSPITVSTGVPDEDIAKDWDYTNDSPVGSAYHWQASMWVVDTLGMNIMLDAKITLLDSARDASARRASEQF